MQNEMAVYSTEVFVEQTFRGVIMKEFHFRLFHYAKEALKYVVQNSKVFFYIYVYSEI